MSKTKIVFICHSTGGIVVRFMLHKERDAFENKRVGVVLIASPSYGAKWANRLRMIVNFYKHRLGAQLQWGNWTLRDLDDDFKNLVNLRQIQNLYGIEAYGNHFIVHRRYLPPRQVLVTKESAGRYFGEPVMLADTDHFSTVKPHGLTHPAHTLLVRFLLNTFRDSGPDSASGSLMSQNSSLPRTAKSKHVLEELPDHPPIAIPPLPQVDEVEVSDARFFGREGLLSDFRNAVSSIVTPSQVQGQRVQLIWYHGFGGLGKRSLLRRALVDVRTQFVGVKIGLIDWYVPRWRYPAEERLLDACDLLVPIAVRLTQLYGTKPLTPFWRAYNQVSSRNVLLRRSAAEAKFDSALRGLETLSKATEIEPQLDVWRKTVHAEREIETARTVLRDASIRLDRGRFAPEKAEFRTGARLREALLHRWGQRCLLLDEMSDLVLRPNHVLIDILQQCIRSAIAQAPLLFMFDTHEKLEGVYDDWVRYLFTPLLYDEHPLILVVAGRSAPDPVGWLNDIPESKRRIVAFSDNVHFTPVEIETAIRRTRPDTQRVGPSGPSRNARNAVGRWDALRRLQKSA